MAVTGNNSSEITGSTFSLYTGLTKCKIIGINPTQKQLEELGVGMKNEPNYEVNDGKSRIDFWVKAENDSTAKFSIFLENEDWVGSGSGKTQYINKYGNTMWSMDGTCDYSWYKMEGVRPCKKGEAQLHEVMQAFLNVKQNEDACQLDTMSDILKGNVTELRTIFLDTFSDNDVMLLWGIRTTDEGKTYQSICTKYFGRTFGDTPYYKGWDTAVNDTKNNGEYAWKDDYQDDWTFKAYVPTSNAPVADDEVTAETANDDTF